MDINTANSFTPAELIQPGETFDVSIRGTFVAKLTVQRSKDQSVWRDVETFEAPVEKVGISGSAWYFRVGVKTGDYTSGTAIVEIYS